MASEAKQPLSSWKDGPTKRAVVEFVERTTTRGRHFVPIQDRVAVFDNDGTLWCEKPLPVQADFLLRRVAEMAKDDARLRDEQPWKAVLNHDYAWLENVVTKHYRGDDRDLKVMARGLLMAYDGLEVSAFQATATHFLREARHPKLGRRYIDCTYQPMLELLGFLEDHAFTSYIVSGGGRDFMRPLAPELYGLTADRVLGSSVALKFRDDGARAELVREAKVDVFDDGPAKPVEIWSRIGRRPIFAGGNSNGDIPMLRFTTQQPGPSFALLINHDDPREFVYTAGAGDALAQAGRDGWTVVSMKADWVTVFPARARDDRTPPK